MEIISNFLEREMASLKNSLVLENNKIKAKLGENKPYALAV